MPNHQEHAQPKSGLPFHTGERVAVGQQLGVIIAAFPDGFHLIRLDNTQEVTGAHISQLSSPADRRSDPPTPHPRDQ